MVSRPAALSAAQMRWQVCQFCSSYVFGFFKLANYYYIIMHLSIVNPHTGGLLEVRPLQVKPVSFWVHLNPK